MLAVVILANQLLHILAAGAVAALADLLIDEELEIVRQGNDHSVGCFGLKFFKAYTFDPASAVLELDTFSVGVQPAFQAALSRKALF